MLKLHVTDTQLGLITTIHMLLQIFSAFISGHLTDRLGRRKAVWVFDVVSWTVGTLLWALSQNFWWFVMAAVFNSFQRIPMTAWYCLLVEDTPPEKRTHVFTGLMIVGVVGGLFAPLGGVLVSHFTLVPAVRIMYALACVSMTAMIYIRHRGITETEIGLRKMSERSTAHFREDLRYYLVTLKQMLKNRVLLLLFAVYVLWNIQLTIRNTFVPVYQVEYLRIPAAFISLFPAVSSIAMIALFLTVVPRFREEHAKTLMNVGFLFLIVANLMLVFIPKESFWLVVVSTVLAAIGTIIANPYIESVVANAIDDEHRATMLSVLNVLILVFTSPAGIVGGWTYSINPRIPICLLVAAFVLSIALVHRAKKESQFQPHADDTSSTVGVSN
jgi:MFS family permease